MNASHSRIPRSPRPECGGCQQPRRINQTLDRHDSLAILAVMFCARFLFIALTLICALTLQAAEPRVAGLRFPLGERNGENPPAKAQVEQLVQGAQKRGFFRVAVLPVLVVNGITITFQRPDVTCLSTFHETLLALTKAEKMEMRRLIFVSAQDKVQRLSADELQIPSKNVWILKNPRLHGRELPKEVRLVLDEGPGGGIQLPDGKRISLEEILDIPPAGAPSGGPSHGGS